MSHRFSDFARTWGFSHHKVASLWPQANGKPESFMGKLSKVIRTCKVVGTCWSRGLQEFLRAYRATLHTVTRVPPAVVFLGFCRLSGIPIMSYSSAEVEMQRKLAVKNNQAAQKKAAEYWNKAHRAT